MFGVDMPPDPPKGEEFIARGRTREQISDKMGMPVIYLSPESMLAAFRQAGIPETNLCTFCIGGCHPFAKLALEAETGDGQLGLL